MIKSGQMVLEFGNGDIGVAGGQAKEDNKIGVVVFCDIEPREIGSFKVNDKETEFPLIMTFTKKESVDVIIEALLNARESMED